MKNLTYLLSAAHVATFIFIAFFFTRCSEEEIVPDGADAALRSNTEPTNHEPSAGHMNAPLADPQPNLEPVNEHTPPRMEAWESLDTLSAENPLVQRVFEAVWQQEEHMRSAIAQGIDFRLLHIRNIRHRRAREGDWVYIPFTGHRNGYQLVLAAYLPSDSSPVQIYLQETTLLEQIEEGEAYHLQYYSLDMTAISLHTTSPGLEAGEGDLSRVLPHWDLGWSGWSGGPGPSGGGGILLPP